MTFMVGSARSLPWRGKQAGTGPSATSAWFQWALESGSHCESDRSAPFRATASPGIAVARLSAPGPLASNGYRPSAPRCRWEPRGAVCLPARPQASRQSMPSRSRRDRIDALWVAGGSAPRRVLLCLVDAPVGLCGRGNSCCRTRVEMQSASVGQSALQCRGLSRSDDVLQSDAAEASLPFRDRRFGCRCAAGRPHSR
jgi:hypothetical protein